MCVCTCLFPHGLRMARRKCLADAGSSSMSECDPAVTSSASTSFSWWKITLRPTLLAMRQRRWSNHYLSLVVRQILQVYTYPGFEITTDVKQSMAKPQHRDENKFEPQFHKQARPRSDSDGQRRVGKTRRKTEHVPLCSVRFSCLGELFNLPVGTGNFTMRNTCVHKGYSEISGNWEKFFFFFFL